MKRFIKWGTMILFICLASCSHKPSDKDIAKKILQEYDCGEMAKLNQLKILKTEETQSTPNIHVFNYTVIGEIEWPDGCAAPGFNAAKGSTVRFEKMVTLTQDKYGLWK